MKNCTSFFLQRLFLPLGTLAIATAVASAQYTAPTTLMQIDGNAAQSAGYGSCTNMVAGSPVSGSCDYWNLLNGTGTGGKNQYGVAGHSLVRSFIDGTASTDSFTTGGSKDFNDLTQWRWSNNPTPNKDTLNAGYGAMYAGTNSDYVLMFGADRASPNGDANIGIWFFQQPVSLNSDGTFSGVHTAGDVFAISAFVNGGGVSAIAVYTWDTTCLKGVKNPVPGSCADVNLRLRASESSTTVCGSSPDCAITNPVATDTTWEGQLASPLFFQGGVNLNSILQSASLPCFSSFLEETRSSQSTTAVLKDFLLGQFKVCGMSITKACDVGATGYGNVVGGGTQIHYIWKGTVTNTGIGTISGAQLTDYLPSATTGAGQTTTGTNETLYTDTTYAIPIAELGPGVTGYYQVAEDVSALSATNNSSASATIGGGTIDATTSTGSKVASAVCSQSVSSSISVTKSCGNPLAVPPAPGTQLICSASGCVVQTNFNAQVCNLGSVKLTNVTLSDDPASNLSTTSIPALSPTGTAGDCATVTGYYTPTSATGDGLTNGRYSFTDTIYVTGATASLGSNPPPAGSTLCPGGPSDLACSQATCKLCEAG
ncbi:MAG TPA: hypothetical protein VGR64_11325, partial [Terracidiphilus sp.]|nr:hypothetical protein [Terracidiphilus sp.]